MKFRMVAFIFAVVLAAVSIAWAADVNGKWEAEVPGPQGQTQKQTFNFKVDGDKLTGTVSGMQGETPISDGKVNGDEISFSQTFNR